MSLYEFVLLGHTTFRWVVLLAIVVVTLHSLVAWRARRGWTRTDERLHAAMVGSVDLQFSLGLALLVLSPLPRALVTAFSQGMKVPALRFFGMEHPLGMLLVTALIHLGRRWSRRSATEISRHRVVWSTTLAAIVLIGVSIPWPGLRHGRPLARGLKLAPTTSTSEPNCPAIYRTRCLACHGAKGRGDGPGAGSLKPRPRDFSDPSWANEHADDVLAAVIRDGGKAHGMSVAMPSHSDLSAEELAELVACLRSFQ